MQVGRHVADAPLAEDLLGARARFTPSQFAAMQRLCGSTSTTAVRPAAPHRGRRRREQPRGLASRPRAAGRSSRRAGRGGGRGGAGAAPARAARRRAAPRAAPRAPQRRRELGARDDDRDEVAERRVAELAAALELLVEEAARRRAGRRTRSGARRAGTSGRARGPGASRPLRPASCVTSWNVRSSARKSGSAERRVRVDHGRELDAGEVVALRDHLRPEQDRAVGARRSGGARRSAPPASRPCRASSRIELELREVARELALEPLRARRRAARARPSRTPGTSPATARRGRSGGSAARRVAVEDERDVAVRAADRRAARAAVERGRDAAPVQEQDRLAAAVGEPRGARRGAAPRAGSRPRAGGRRRAPAAARR